MYVNSRIPEHSIGSGMSLVEVNTPLIVFPQMSVAVGIWLAESGSAALIQATVEVLSNPVAFTTGGVVLSNGM